MFRPFNLVLLLVAACCASTKPEKILLITNEESGQGNVFLATSHALAIEYNDVEVHFASWRRLQPTVATINEYVEKSTPNARPIVFHKLPGPSWKETLASVVSAESVRHAPGLSDQNNWLHNLEQCSLPWSGDDLLVLHEHILDLLAQINPDVIVVDTLLSPAVTTVRDSGRRHVILSANTIKDHWGMKQSLGKGFWSLPAYSSGYPYPLPWYMIPGNILMNLRTILSVLRPQAAVAAKRAYVMGKGAPEPVMFLNAVRPGDHWIVPSLSELEYPMVIPANVSQCGPIYLSSAPLKQQDPELAEWLSKGPTILVNLGSHTNYDDDMASNMASALSTVLSRDKNLQLLWKFHTRPNHQLNATVLAQLDSLKSTGRVRMSSWIKADPAALLESGDVILSVHHGGANSFNEAIATGVPHIILPMWMDTYDFASRVEWLGVGVWANKRTAPKMGSEEFEAALRMMLDGEGARAQAMRRKAKEVAVVARNGGGRDCAAKAIVDVMRGSSELHKGAEESNMHDDL